MTSRPTDEPRTVTVGVVVGGVVGWDNGAIPTVVATSTCCWKTHTSPVIKLGWKPNLQYTATYIFLMIQLQLTKKRSFRLLVRLSPLKSPWLTEKIQTAEHLSCLSIYWSRSTSPKIKFLQCKSALFSIHSPSLYGQTVQGPMQTTVGTTLKSTHLPSRSTSPTHPEVAMCSWWDVTVEELTNSLELSPAPVHTTIRSTPPTAFSNLQGCPFSMDIN